MMGAGGRPTPRAPSGGPAMYGQQNFGNFGNFEPRKFSQDNFYGGKKTSLATHADANARRQPFHTFDPRASFQPAQTFKLHKTPIKVPAEATHSMQSRPPAEEVLSEVVSPTSRPSEADRRDENITSPRVSLPKEPATAPGVPFRGAWQERKPQPTDAPCGADKSPVKPPKKPKNKAAQRAKNFEAEKNSVSISATSSSAGDKHAVSKPEPDANPPAVAEPKGKEAPTSLFTANQIKDRRQAWDRIAVPLSSPRKPSLAAEDGLLGKPGHDRSVSLPASMNPTLSASSSSDKGASIANDPVKKVAENVAPTEEAPANEAPTEEAPKDAQAPEVPEGTKPVLHIQTTGSEPASSVASSTSPKKSGGRRNKKKSGQAKPPAKKEHKL